MDNYFKGMKQGDWTCAKCGDHQFARNTECRQCGTSKGKSEIHKKPGDWQCSDAKCGYLNFAKNAACHKCQLPCPDHEASMAAWEAGIASGLHIQKTLAGDWNCPSCNDHQFAKNAECRKCGTPNPDPEASAAAMAAAAVKKGSAKGGGWNEGHRGSTAGKAGGKGKDNDWYCSGCGDLQFGRNTHCRQCGMPGMGGGKGGGKGDMAGMAGDAMGVLASMFAGMGGGGGGGGQGRPMQGLAQALLATMGSGGGGNGNWDKGKGGAGGKGKGGKGDCRWCAQGECWDHGGGKGFSPY